MMLFPVASRLLMKRALAVLLAVLITLPPTSAMAEYLGLLSGREADPGKSTDLSLELGFVTGDLGVVDYQNIAARLNYRLTPELVFIGSAGVGEFGDFDGVPLGFGFMYHLSNQRISDKVEIAGKASYHTGDYSLRDVDGDLSNVALEVLFSGAQPLMANGLSWYSNLGFHRTTTDFGKRMSSNDAGLGAGLVLPTGLGEAYLGFDLIDELVFGLGIRYFISNNQP